MKKIIYILIFFACINQSLMCLDYQSNAIYIKYKTNYKLGDLQSNNTDYQIVPAFNLRMFDSKTYGEKADSLIGELMKIRKVVFKTEIDPIKMAKKFSEYENVDFAEPIPIDKIFADETNDPELSRLYQLYITKTIDAWKLMIGDTVLIGIVDTGIDFEHEDLTEMIWHNQAEMGLDDNGKDKSTNGIDDDNNGFIDDWRGWDFGSEKGYDNDPTYGNTHGVHVAGIAAAQVNNGKGVAGMCPRAKILPVKIGADFGLDNSVNNEYEGLLYAASMGAKVINCSWGSAGYSKVNQLAIETATELGALVVAAAGNDSKNEKFYPSSYEQVISVASTAEDDVRSGFSNYSTAVDISAPGTFIYSTVPDNKYDYMSGTSMASPVLAGAAAVLRSQYPAYSPKQIKYLLIVNADDISEQNPLYNGLIGSGRLNLLSAINRKNNKAVSLDSYFVHSESKYNIIEAGEKISIDINFENVLDSIDNLELVIGNDKLFPLVISNQKFNFNSLSTGEKFKIENELNITIPNNILEDYNYKIKITAYVNGVRIQDFYLEFLVNQSFINLVNDEIGMTVTGKGNFGFNDFPNNLQGIGLEYGNQQNALYEGGFMITQKGNDYVANGVRSGSGYKSNDLFSLEKIKIEENNLSQMIKSKFSDKSDDGINLNDSVALGIDISQKAFLFKDENLKQSILIRYELFNKNDYDMDSVYSGLFFDWDISSGGQEDYIYFDTTSNSGIAESLNSVDLPLISVSLLSEQKFNCYAIDNAAFADEMGIYDGFTDKEKQKALTSGYGRLKSRESKDVSMVLGAGPMFIPSNKSVILYFSISLGYDIDELNNDRNQLIKKMESLEAKSNIAVSMPVEIIKITPNPANNNQMLEVMIHSNIDNGSKVKIYDYRGRMILDLGNKRFSNGYDHFSFSSESLSQGAYYLVIENKGQLVSFPFTIVNE